MIRLSAIGWLVKKCWLTETMCPEIYISAASTWSQGHDLQRICTASVMLRNWNLVWQEGKIIVYEFRSFCMGNTSAKTIPPKQEELRLRSIDIRMKPRVKDRLWYTKNSKNHGNRVYEHYQMPSKEQEEAAKYQKLDSNILLLSEEHKKYWVRKVLPLPRNLVLIDCPEINADFYSNLLTRQHASYRIRFNRRTKRGAIKRILCHKRFLGASSFFMTWRFDFNSSSEV